MIRTGAHLNRIGAAFEPLRSRPAFEPAGAGLGRGEPHDAVLRRFIKSNEVADSMRVLLTIHKRLSDLNLKQATKLKHLNLWTRVVVMAGTGLG